MMTFIQICVFLLFCAFASANYREDLRCGAGFPAPNGEDAICSCVGQYPCCSNWGWCGYTDDHCLCANCVDYRKTSCQIRPTTPTLQPDLPTYTGRPSSLSVTGSSVELSWREWSTGDGDLGDPPVVGYIVHYKKASSSEAWSNTPQVTVPTATVTGLHWEEEYSFAVAAVREGAGGEGPRGSEVLTTSTICGEPSAPEVSTETRSEFHKTIRILWQPLTETESKCTTGVEQYTITYRPVNTDVSKSLTNETTSTSYTIMGLGTYTEYVISVKARNKDANGTVRLLQEFSPEEKAPVPGVSTTHEGSFLTVSVYPSDSFSRNLYGNINGYEVRYRSRDSDEWKNQSITEDQGSNSYKITSVEDVDYEVSARVINGAGVGNWSPFFTAEQGTSTGTTAHMEIIPSNVESGIIA